MPQNYLHQRSAAPRGLTIYYKLDSLTLVCMRVAHLVIVALLIVVFSACTKNSVSNIPFITFTSFGAAKGGALIGKANKDAMILAFSLTDGDGDLGRSDQNDVYV